MTGSERVIQDREKEARERGYRKIMNEKVELLKCEVHVCKTMLN